MPPPNDVRADDSISVAVAPITEYHMRDVIDPMVSLRPDPHPDGHCPILAMCDVSFVWTRPSTGIRPSLQVPMHLMGQYARDMNEFLLVAGPKDTRELALDLCLMFPLKYSVAQRSVPYLIKVTPYQCEGGLYYGNRDALGARADDDPMSDIRSLIDYE